MNASAMKGIAACLAGIMTTGCAALLVNGTTQRVAVASAPPGAQVTMDGRSVGLTPVDVFVSRRSADMVLGADTVLRIEKDGFRAHETTLERSLSGWLLFDIPFGVMMGLASGQGATSDADAWVGAAMFSAVPFISFFTGGAYALPDRVAAVLERVSEPATPEGVAASAPWFSREGLVLPDRGSRPTPHGSSPGLRGGPPSTGREWRGLPPALPSVAPLGPSRLTLGGRALRDRVPELPVFEPAGTRDAGERSAAARHQ